MGYSIMEFITEVDTAIKSGLDGFKSFIEQKLAENCDYLEHSFWMEDGSQMTVLNYLIQQHQEKTDADTASFDLTAWIDFAIGKLRDKNTGEPLHQVLAIGKARLAQHLLNNYTFDVNRRDEEGRTLLSLALATKNKHLLEKILEHQPNVNAITRVTEARTPFQPLHEAIVLDFAFGVRNLGKAGAELANPVGTMKDTPVLLAARMGKIKALGALLEFPVEKLDIEAESNYVAADKDKKAGDNAIEALCKALARDSNNQNLIYGVAMLLCRGAEPPRNQTMCQLLVSKRSDLLRAIDRYMESRPELVDPFVHRCHLAGSALHKIVYVAHSWGSALRQLLGRPSEAGVLVERLVTRKYGHCSEENSNASLLSKAAAAAESLREDESSLRLYAEFVRRYNEAYEGQRITNPWSTMRWMIAEGKGSWDSVQQYALSHPGSRTQIIYDDMLKNMPKVKMHESIEVTNGIILS